jgi:hypothetical protein
MLELAIAALLIQEPSDKEEDPTVKVAAAAKKAREALEFVTGIRAVAYAGVDKSFRLIVSVDDEETRAQAREKLGFEYEGFGVLIYSSDTRAAIVKKADPDAEPPKAEKSEPRQKGSTKAVDRRNEAAAAELKELEEKSFTTRGETVAIVELLQCDAVREAYGMPAVKREKKEGLCTYVIRTTFGGRMGGSREVICKHREGCPFASEKLLAALPKEVREALARYAELLKHPDRAKPKK